ncbi:SDR family NAD(P)-dependent oxidoreductase [Stigmatella sp. ncwal1]|uniref:SDR family NAD(P)-dependent oxidoreductase n=1 Tax=Stigmatella ashevillensis TaxID=2995309 RepID=A0ABT5D180_9BACT|nr:SDR family NAD(P)-dependent oxidoreductase [Stigmatella ashevillena]MDC0707422.1 SDR family NAD(P)-dependent oxidoreductase [Stigmatella ashevillena]
MSGKRTQILQAVQSGAMTPEEGMRQLRALSFAVSSEPEPPLAVWRSQWYSTGALSEVGAQGALGDVLILDRDESFRAACLSSHGPSRAESAPGPVLVMRGTRFERVDARTYRVDPRQAGDFRRLVEALRTSGVQPARIISLWGASSPSASEISIETALEEGFDTIVHLIQALHEHRLGEALRILCVHTDRGGASGSAHAALSGLGHALWLENPLRVLRTIEVAEPVDRLSSACIEALLGEPDGPPARIRYADGKRWVRGWDGGEVVTRRQSPGNTRLRDRGVYLITGGLGGLGRILSEHLARCYRARLVISGRRALTPEGEAALESLRSHGAEVLYVATDVTHREGVSSLITAARRRFGALHGIFHGAGVAAQTGILLEKSLASMRAVMAPKVVGAVLLDEATREDPLDFFVLLSSLASLGLSEGVGEYAFANRFLDELAEQRNARVKRGEGGSGETLSIDWPYWQSGGMRHREPIVADMRERAGLEPLSTADGLTFLDWVLEHAPAWCLPIAGDRAVFAGYLAQFESHTTSASSAELARAPAGQEALNSQAEKFLRHLTAELVGLPDEEIALERRLSDYGLNSIALTRLMKLLSTKLGPLPQTLLLEYQTLAELRDFLLKHHAAALASALKGPSQEAPPPASRTAVPLDFQSTAPERGGGFASPRPVAVIGMSGRYPGARDVRGFYANLKAGRRALSELPGERGSWSRWFDPQPERAAEGRIYRRTGGFISGVELFDPLAFQMTPAEAKGIHPEERLLLQAAWEAIEDAGYAHTALEGKRHGVFIGVNGLSYPLLGLERWAQRGDVLLDQSYFGLPNRISHFFDLRGPSVPFDTGCSSALVALDAARRAIAQGECDGALVGGVNLYLHVSRFSTLCQARLASTHEAPLLFERGGDGFVPGEGIGMVLLKPLDDALRDGDHVYGVIRATAVSHKGRSSSYLLPSPPSQRALIERTLTEARVSPTDIGYVELQAVGAEMTDVSEWRSLSAVFGGVEEGARCALGSVKPLIGHLEAASGMAQLTRVLLQLDHGELFPTPLAANMHEGISVDTAPFYVPAKSGPWPHPRRANGEGWTPRRALLGSAAAGGTQVFTVLEECERAPRAAVPRRDELILLSGRSSEQLRRTAVALRDHVVSEEGAALSLADIAFVLQAGREAFTHRFAAVVADREQLIAVLEGVSQKGEGAAWGRGAVVDRSRTRAPLSEEAAAAIYGRRDLKVAAEQWLANAVIDWTRVPGAELCRRVSLPTHSFEQRRCWVDDRVEAGAKVEVKEDSPNVVSGYYNRFAAEVDPKEEIYLIFPFFPEKLPGFSWLMTFFEPHRRPEHARYMLARQKDMKAVLYRHVDFSRVRTVMDIGCGLATDLIQLALRHPKLSADGFTIAQKQVDVARTRITRAGLSDRLHIDRRDSSKDPFPRRYDLIIGFEVVFHIEDKNGVFSNIAEHLEEGGLVVLADGVANTVTEINLPHLGQFTSTVPQLAEILGRHGLRVVSCVDTSQGVSRFLDDDQLEENLARLRSEYPESAHDEGQHRGWANFGKALGARLIRYLLFTLEKAPAGEDRAGLVLLNQSRIEGAQPFPSALQALETKRLEPVRTAASSDVSMERQLVAVAAEVFEMAPTELDPTASFKDYGIGSLTGLRFIDAVNRRLHLRLKMEHFFQCPDLRSLSAFIREHEEIRGAVVSPPVPPPSLPVAHLPSEEVASEHAASARPIGNNEPIAVIGMAGRFPGAENVAQLWDNLRRGVDSVTRFPVKRLEAEGWEPTAARALAEGCWGGFIEGIEDFEPTFFGISPAEAEMMDPQQRLFLEQCWVALEGAGYSGRGVWGARCGVIVGLSGNEYQDKVHGDLNPDQLSHAMLGNFASLTASRIAYFLNLRGPTITVDTACSSSLVSVHLACQSLRNGEAELMLAGGVTLYLSPGPLGVMRHVGMLSPSGRCRAFSEDADGIAIGEGVGVVLLKPLSRALADGDVIHGIIRGSGTNQDGRTNGITAPSLDAQKLLEIDVYEKSAVNPETLSYVECHGTGTKLGDPIEIAALTEAFRHFTRKRQYCAVGSLKSNIGHTTAAAGIGGLIKVLLALKHRQLPPTLHVKKENKHIAFKNTPFYVNTELKEWTTPAEQPRRAAISAFGFSGANCHLVVEDAPTVEVVSQPMARATTWVVPVSAPTPERLRDHVTRLLKALSSEDATPAVLRDVAYTLQVGRREFPHRVALVASELTELRSGWTAFLDGQERPGLHVAQARPGAALIQVESASSDALAAAWVAGAEIDWQSLHVEAPPRRVLLPGLPFVRRRCWIARPPNGPAPAAAAEVRFYRPVWEAAAPTLHPDAGRVPVLLFNVDPVLLARFLESRRARGGTGEVVSLVRGASFTVTRTPEGLQFSLDPSSPDHLRQCAQALEDAGLIPGAAVVWRETSRETTQVSELAAAVPFLQWLLRIGKTRLRRVILVLPSEGAADPVAEACVGFGASLRNALPELYMGALHLPSHAAPDVAARAILEEVDGADTRAHELRSIRGERQVRTFRPVEPRKGTGAGLRQGGVYLITGGNGGLGLLVARHWAKRYGASLILTGRRAPDEALEAELRQIQRLGGRARYFQADVADRSAMRGVVQEAEQTFGRLNGVVHAAGVIDSTPFMAKDVSSFAAGLKPKVEGVLALDEVTRGCALEFFVLFSSISAILGDFGGCDYAVANRFLDGFARLREEQCARGERSGRTLSLNWPTWRHGGMHFEREAEALYLRTSGMSYLEDESGLDAIESALLMEGCQIAVLSGQQGRLDRMVDAVAEPPRPFPVVAAPASIQTSTFLRDELRQEAAAVLALQPEEMTFDGNFGDFGFDSISLRTLAARLSARFGVSLAAAAFYAHPTLDALAAHLTTVHPAAAPLRPPPVPALEARAPVPVSTPLEPEPIAVRAPFRVPAPLATEPIAVVGLSGVFPGADNVEAFWKNLVCGQTALVPARMDRYDDTGDKAESPAEYWGGYLREVDRFDADFFRISPREAELMDPQQRLLLQTIWNTFEDAGVAPAAVSRGRTGVFIGVDKFDYSERLQSAIEAIDPHSAAGIHPAMIANRISYFFNLKGPSEVVNTGCSSAAVALHRASGALRNGECDTAVVGGVNVLLSPAGFMAAQYLGGTSKSGQPRPFDQDADGSVRGEVVGAVLLKRLSQAEADGDHIYGVLLGSAAAHGGRGHSLTAPNVNAQAEVIIDAYRQAGIEPETVQYIEAQGAANELGDAVEVESFKAAFQRLAPSQRGGATAGTCGISCLKGSVGHSEGASGIAALIKVLMAFQHETLPGVAGFQKLHPQLQLEGSPFFVVAGNRRWSAGPMGLARRAAVHSYGFGGVCAHLLLESYSAPREVQRSRSEAQRLIVLSAQDDERLDARIREMLAFLESPPEGRDLALVDVAFTLLDGRTALDARLAVVSSSIEELASVLRQVLGGAAPPSVSRGVVSRKDGAIASLFDGAEGDEIVRMLLRSRSMGKLAKAWVAGATLDTSLLFAGEKPRRVGLPTYPFRKERHWLRAAPVTPRPPVFTSPSAEHSSEQPTESSTIVADLQGMLSELLKRDGLDLDRPLVEYGLDSFMTTTFMRAVQRRYGASVSLAAPLAHPTIRKLGAYLTGMVGMTLPVSGGEPLAVSAASAARGPSSGPCPELLTVNPGGQATPSFWFHGAPGLAQMYYRLSDSLGPNYPFYALQARGVDGKSAPFTTLRGMIDHYIDAIRGVQPRGPYVLGGYSFGGLLAFEAAQQLKRRGEEVKHLVMFDTYPPEMLEAFERSGGTLSAGTREIQRLMNAMMFFSAELDTPVWDFISLDELKKIPSGAQLAHLAQLIKERVKTALSADEIYSFLTGVDTIVGITETITRSYRLSPYDASDVLYFKTARFLEPDSGFVIPNVTPEDVGVSIDTLKSLEALDYTMAWREVTRRMFKVVNFDCDHMSLFLKPALDEVCGHLRTLLAPGA